MPSEPSLAHSYAQTNLQLYNQLVAAGCEETELASVRAAYELGMRLFSGQYRPSGKPLIDHLVGTASILAAEGLPTHCVVAGLLHAAYPHGVFADARPGVTRKKRRVVRGAVGREAEALIERYAGLRWDGESIAQIQRELGTSEPERELLAVRLANELEDHLDLGQHYCGEGLYHELYRGPALEAAVAIARGLRLPALGDALERTVRASNAASLPAVLRRDEVYGGRVDPESDQST